MTDRTNKTHAAGYRQPPVATRFKPGRSGNPKGRPKGARNFSTAIENEMNARIVVTESGKRKTITKREAVAKQLVNKAVSGDPRALPTLLNAVRHHETLAASPTAVGYFNTPDDALVMEDIVRRIREMRDSAPPEAAPDDPPDGNVGSRMPPSSGYDTP